MSSGGQRPRGPERTKVMATAKRSARSKLAHLRAPKDKTNIEEIADMLDLPKWEDIDERNADSRMEAGHYARKEALADGDTEEEADEKAEKAEMEADSELYNQWYDAVEHVAEKLFDEHGLKLVGKKYKAKKRQSNRPFDFTIVPEKSWEHAASRIMTTINGVGSFEFSSVKEFMDSGPYTAREAVLNHLHWIKDWPRVYGEGTARGMYDRQVR
jgi:hypothetical protein